MGIAWLRRGGVIAPGDVGLQARECCCCGTMAIRAGAADLQAGGGDGGATSATDCSTHTVTVGEVGKARCSRAR